MIPAENTCCLVIEAGSILVSMTISSATTNMMIWMSVDAESTTIAPSASGTVTWNAGNAVATTRMTPARNRYALRAAPLGSSGSGSLAACSDLGGAIRPAFSFSW